GSAGEDLKNLILKGRVEIRGEVYMGKADFKKLNRELQKEGKVAYSNPRNLAAGSIRQLDPKLAAARPLKFLAYDMVADFGQDKHSQEHSALPMLGFRTDPGKVCRSLSEILAFWREIISRREKLPYQIDGIVINVNDNSLFEKLGVAGKSPRGVRALKFSPKQATTRILDIKLQVGRTGAVTPVAVLEPVLVEGVTITRATLHNEGEIKKLGVKIGDTVIVERAGDVIPDVAKVLPELRVGEERDFHFPKTCPVCRTELKKPKEEAIWRCQNMDCPARKRGNLYYFTSKKAFNIEGLGPKIIDKLVDENLISQPDDMFTLKEGDLIPLERFAERSAKNLVEAIQKSKKISLSKFILSLGIRHVGEETAIDLANSFTSINKLRKATGQELENIPDVGPKVAESIYAWFGSEQNQNFINNLLRVGVEILAPEKISKKLAGQTFVFTGVLKAITRDQAKKMVRSLSGAVSESVSKATDYLVAGADPGSKLKQANNLGIRIINEQEFIKIVG
ncbi:MAG: NAD-dependent DNA ligase LigA, partial [bacterium]|nr:NAD-dependent DNA ligase LigA [bacterium]